MLIGDLVTRATLDYSGVSRGMRGAVAEFERGTGQIDRIGANAFGGLATAATRAASALGLVFGGREVIQAADAWQNAANRLALITSSAEAAEAAQNKLFAVAQDTRTAYGATVDVFFRFSKAAEALGASQSEVLTVTRAVNQSLALSGTSADSAQAAITQLGQGLASGVLRGEELNSVLEQAPRLAQALADGLGVSVGELRALGEAGTLTSDRVFGALEDQATAIATEFGKLAPTIGQAFQQVENSAQRFIGTTSQASGAGQVLAATLSTVATHFETIADAAVLGGAVVGLRRLVPVALEVQGALAGIVSVGAAEEALARKSAITELSRAQAANAAAAAKVRQLEANVANLRTLAAEVDQNLRLNASLAATVTSTKAAAVYEARLVELRASDAAVTRALTGAEAALAAERKGLALSSAASAVAQGRFARAMTTTSVASGAAATAGRLFGKVVALLGGAEMAAATGGLVALGGAYLIVKRNAREAANEMERFQGTFTELSDQQVNAQLAVNRAKLELAQSARRAPTIRGGIVGLRQIDEEIAKRQLLVNVLEREQSRRAVIHLNTAPSGKDVLSDEIDRLSKLRELGGAKLKELDRIASIVQSSREELAGIGDQTDEKSQARRLELLERIAKLTRQTNLDKTGAKDAAREFSALGERSDALVTSFKQLAIRGAGLQVIPENIGRALPLIEAAGAQVSELRTQLAALESIDPFGTQTAAVRTQISALEDAQAAWSGYTDTIKRLPAIDLSGLPRTVAPVRIDPNSAVARHMEELGRQAEETARKASKLKINLSAVAATAHGIVQVADAFGHMDDQMRRTIDGTAALISGFAELKKIRDAQTAARFENPFDLDGEGGIFGTLSKIGALATIVGGVAGIVGGLFNRGPSPVEIALDQNNEELGKLRVALLDVRGTFTTLTRQAQIARTVVANPRAVLENSNVLRVQGIVDRSSLDRQLASLGTTFEQINELARQYGITLVDGKNRILLPAFQQLADALDLAREAALRWDTSVRGVSDRIAARTDIFDVLDTPVQRFADQVAVLNAVAPQIGQLFDGIDVNTAEGRAIAERTIRRLFSQLDTSSGALTLLKNTGFESLDEFLTVLLDADHALDSFTQTTLDATAALLNVPTGFKVALRRFESTTAALADALPTVTTTTTPTATSPRLATPTPVVVVPSQTADTSAQSGRGGGSTVITFTDGAIRIDGADYTPAELFNQILAEAQRVAQTTGGMAARPVEAFQ